MKAVIRLDVPDYQIGQPVSVYFKDTMEKHGLCCEREQELVRCKDCKYVRLHKATDLFPDMPVYAECTLTDETHEPDWFCADGES